MGYCNPDGTRLPAWEGRLQPPRRSVLLLARPHPPTRCCSSGDVGPPRNQLCPELQCPSPPNTHMTTQTHLVSSSRETRDHVATGQDRPPPESSSPPQLFLHVTPLLSFSFLCVSNVHLSCHHTPLFRGPTRASAVWPASKPLCSGVGTTLACC